MWSTAWGQLTGLLWFIYCLLLLTCSFKVGSRLCSLVSMERKLNVYFSNSQHNVAHVNKTKGILKQRRRRRARVPDFNLPHITYSCSVKDRCFRGTQTVCVASPAVVYDTVLSNIDAMLRFPFPLSVMCMSTLFAHWNSAVLHQHRQHSPVFVCVTVRSGIDQRGKKSTAATLYPSGHVPLIPEWKLPLRETLSTNPTRSYTTLCVGWGMWSRLAERPGRGASVWNREAESTHRPKPQGWFPAEQTSAGAFILSWTVHWSLFCSEHQRSRGLLHRLSDHQNCLLALWVRGQLAVWSSTCGWDCMRMCIYIYGRWGVIGGQIHLVCAFSISISISGIKLGCRRLQDWIPAHTPSSL